MSNNTTRRYRYIGPDDLKRLVGVASKPIATPEELQDVLKSIGFSPDAEERTATYVIDLDGYLRLANRRSEHVACAGGADVLGAGEITFDFTREGPVASWVTNQSTGYCPDLDSWSAVEKALKRLGVQTPEEFSLSIVFRRCQKCGQTNIVKDAYFECGMCGAQLPQVWNFN